MALYEIYTFFNKLLLEIQIRIWFKNHTILDFEKRMIELGCTKVNTRHSVIFTTSNKLGKIEITENEIIINRG